MEKHTGRPSEDAPSKRPPGGRPDGGSGSPDITQLTDLAEKGRGGQSVDKRLYMQLLVFTGATETKPLVTALKNSGLEAVLYENLNDPFGVGLLTMSEDPSFFIDTVRPFLKKEPFSGLTLDPAFTMFGRTYGLGHEENLTDWLLNHSRRWSRNRDWPWAIWYPLRRKGSFNTLPPAEQGKILREHGAIGQAFGKAGLAKDIRLASFALDRSDNDFTIGLIGTDLLPLSKIVQAMRATVQTAEYAESLGPFFIGKAIYQAKLA